MQQKTVLEKVSTIVKFFVITLFVLTLLKLPFGERIDAYYMIGSGNYMLDTHSIQHVMPEAPFDATLIVQNWLVCIVYAIAYRIGATLGIGWFVLSFLHVCSICFLLFAIRFITAKISKNSFLFWIVSLLFLLEIDYMTAYRVHVLTYAIDLWCMYLSYLVCKEGMRGRYALGLMGLYLLYVNIQGAMVLVLFGLSCIVAFLSDVSIRNRLSVCIHNGVCLVTSLVCNPYGIRMFTYSLGLSGLDYGGKQVLELTPIWYWPIDTCCEFVVIVSIVGLLTWFWYKTRQFSVKYMIVLIGSVLVSMLALRLVAIVVIILAFVVTLVFDTVYERIYDTLVALPSDAQVRYIIEYNVSGIGALVFVFTLAVCGILGTIDYYMYRDVISNGIDKTFSSDAAYRDASNTLALEYIDSPEGNVFCDTLDGSRLAMLGYKVAMTSRWEVWSQPNPWSDNWASDYFDSVQSGQLKGAMNAVDWDYYLLDTNGSLAMAMVSDTAFESKYEILYFDDTCVLLKPIV